MRRDRVVAWRSWDRSWTAALATAAVVGLLATAPAPLLPVARGYRDLCAQYPMLALWTGHLPALPVAFLLSVVVLSLFNGSMAAATRLVGTLRFNRDLRRSMRAVPTQLARVGNGLGLSDQVVYLEHPRVAAFCYGFARPRVAVTAGLFARLDDDELAAVLAHERHHLRRRDPLRYLALHALAAAAFMFPLVPALRRRLQARIELGADRAALAVAPRGALAGALFAVLTSGEAIVVGAAGLSATEARIAQLAGHPVLPAIPARAIVASLGLVAIIGVAAVDLATPADVVQMACALCASTR